MGFDEDIYYMIFLLGCLAVSLLLITRALKCHGNVKEKLISSINDPLLERKVTRIIKKVNRKVLEMKEKTTSFWFLATFYFVLSVYILLNLTYLVLVLTRYI